MWKNVNAKELKLEITQGEDLLDTMLALSYDNIVNKILQLLSLTSVEDSFYLMIPRFDQLVKYTVCFQLYVDQWFFQTT